MVKLINSYLLIKISFKFFACFIVLDISDTYDVVSEIIMCITGWIF